MRTEAARYIEVTKETRKNLEKALGCTDRMIRNALTYVSDTELARKIRYIAVEEYGATPMRHCPECETLFTTEIDGEQYMRQNFNNGAVLLWHKGTPEVIVRYRGNEELFLCESMPQLSEIQLYAESL